MPSFKTATIRTLRLTTISQSADHTMATHHPTYMQTRLSSSGSRRTFTSRLTWNTSSVSKSIFTNSKMSQWRERSRNEIIIKIKFKELKMGTTFTTQQQPHQLTELTEFKQTWKGCCRWPRNEKI